MSASAVAGKQCSSRCDSRACSAYATVSGTPSSNSRGDPAGAGRVAAACTDRSRYAPNAPGCLLSTLRNKPGCGWDELKPNVSACSSSRRTQKKTSSAS
eukprot:6093448-Prymnesium_polylepis.2